MIELDWVEGERAEYWCEDEYYQLVKFWNEKLDDVMTTTVTTPQQQTQGPVVKEVTVINSVGSSQPGCEKTNSCFDPYRVMVNIGDTVTWQNADNADHTVTGGSAADGPSDAFDSSLMRPGSSFSVEFPYEGTYPYFCMVHPWMQGSVVVSSIVAIPPTQQQTQQPTQQQTQQPKGGGCLIATAAFGSEMAPQVQFLREIRDNTVLQTESGSAFMTGFNQFYYSFSPAVADYERENPTFKEAVKLTLTPLLASLTLLQYADIDSESEMLGYGIGIILLNIGMYFVAPAILIMKVRKRV
jgi:plastocyanin